MRQGGSYIVEKKGARPKKVAGTEPHPKGPRARDAEGRPLDKAAETNSAPAPKTAPEPVKEKRP